MTWRSDVLLSKPDILRLREVPASHYDFIKDGPISTVARAWFATEGGQPQWVAVKTATVTRKFAKEPHDIIKELRVISGLAHVNIIHVIGSFLEEPDVILNMYMPYIPLSLADLLISPRFSPHILMPPSAPEADAATLRAEQFGLMARSIIWQTLRAVAYLHADERKIAHRDIKPSNILLTPDGCVKLIDFGTAWKEAETDTAKNKDLWPELKEKLYFEVSTGGYRAPELLFGTRAYDPLAIDLWSLGATVAEFFTALRLTSEDKDDGDDDDAENESESSTAAQSLTPFVIPRYLRIGYPDTQWTRHTLFNGDRGEIGLAWSIFKIMGTPNAETWPEFEQLPGARSIVFDIVPATPLCPLLPNLPCNALPSCTSTELHRQHDTLPGSPSAPVPSSCLGLISQLLVYRPQFRLSAARAVRHPWLVGDGATLILPPGYDSNGCVEGNKVPDEDEEWHAKAVYMWKGKSLGDLLSGALEGFSGS